MRILHLDSGKHLAGGQLQVLRLIEGLAREGVESTLLAVEDRPLFATALAAGWHVEPLNAVRAIRLGRRHDLVHAHDGRTHTFGLMVPGRPLVVSRRVAYPIGSPWKYRRADHYIAVSEYVKAMLVVRRVPPEKVTVIYDGVPLLPQSSGKNPNPTVISKLPGWVPCPQTNDLEGDLRDAPVLVYISDSEGLGSGALLAMAAGVPVIASPAGGLVEVVRDGETGLLARTHEQMKAALEKLMGDPDLRRRMGAAARQSVEERFTVQQMVRNTLEVYRKVLA